MKLQGLLLLLMRLFLGALFIYSGVVKIINPAAFAEAIDNYRMLPYLFVTLMAIILPWVELIAGVLLLIGRWLRSSSLIIMLLNIVFIIAITSAIFRGLDIGCGCFSVSEDAAKVGVLRLLEDILYLILAIILFRSQTIESAH
ncbi:DoxX family membrane protein [candidate division KSB1 bacterium]|nr:DoxX family membrane protein [candidate division KSB1 bacterium]RQW02722.1 MAG: DoxX family membrane protein [candidate division KSB1 bacterium]